MLQARKPRTSMIQNSGIHSIVVIAADQRHQVGVALFLLMPNVRTRSSPPMDMSAAKTSAKRILDAGDWAELVVSRSDPRTTPAIVIAVCEPKASPIASQEPTLYL